MDKQSLRKEIKNKKRQFTSQELCELSFPVVMRLLSHPRIKTAKTVMLYYSLPDEVDTHTLVDSLLMSGKHILLLPSHSDPLRQEKQHQSCEPQDHKGFITAHGDP